VSRKLQLTIFNQCVSSGTSFAFTLCLISLLGGHQFGAYSISFSIALLYGGICNALFTTQLVVNLPERDDRASYVGFMGGAIVLFGLASTSIGIVLNGLIGDAYSDGWILSTMALCVAYSLRDFVLRVSYSIGGQAWVLAMNVIAAVGLTVGSALFMIYLNIRESLTAIALLAAAYSAAAVAGATLQSNFKIGHPRSLSWRLEIKGLLSTARWTLSGVALIWLQSQAHIYFSALHFGVAAAGKLNAARIAITPFQLVSSAAAQFALPLAARMRRQEGCDAIKSLARRYTRVMAGLASAYCAAVVLSVNLLADVSGIPLGLSKVVDLRDLVFAWLFVLVAQSFRESISTVMQAQKRFAEILVANTLSVSVVLIVLFASSHQHGLEGVVVVIGAGELILALTLCARLFRTSRHAS